MSFTGSTRAGIAVAQASAATVKRVQQELGGKSANIILDDVADLEKSVKGGAGHCFLNSGQSCNAPTRMLVSSNNYEKAVEIAAATANNTSVGDPNGEFRMGPISNKTQYDKVVKMIEIGIEEGARLVAGGVEKPDGCEKGYYVKPTVFADVT
jgi:aldehyde dehydrogenase (NAD+)